MIIGIGTDIVHIPRIEAIITRFPAKVPARILSENELAQFQALLKRNYNKALYFLAKRFAAKEACAKALGTGFREGLRFTDIVIENDKKGRPNLALSNHALSLLTPIYPELDHAIFHLSLSDDPPYATAMVVIESPPPKQKESGRGRWV